MSFQAIAVPPKFKKVIQLQQTVAAADAALLAPTNAQMSAAQILPNSGVYPRGEGIFIQALPANSGTITVTSVNPAVSLGAGYVLSAGQSLNLPTNNSLDYRVNSSAAAQILNVSYGYGQV
jgi:hypothetical protein